MMQMTLLSHYLIISMTLRLNNKFLGNLFLTILLVTLNQLSHVHNVKLNP
jgi:hypothetical protein